MRAHNLNYGKFKYDIVKGFKPLMMLLVLSVTSFYCKAQEEMGAPGNGITETKMVNPDIDDPDKPWCYLQNSTTVIGVPYMPDAVQVTYDGAIYIYA